VLLANLALAGLLVTVTFMLHFVGMVGLTWFMRKRLSKHPHRMTSVFWQGAAIVFVVLGLFALHSMQIWIYAFVYLALGEFSSVETALYFSTSTFTTVGFGDIVLADQWRMLAAAESANGFLLIGWSTAFLVSVTSRLRIFEADIERLEAD
jgi:hypothetical protein